MTTKKITITMSESAPVKIDPEEWPVIASANDFTGQYDFQANYVWGIDVREHADGRRIVSGCHVAGPGGAPADFSSLYAGFLLHSGEDTIRAIRRVAGVVGRPELAAQCIAELPAVEL